ncbi:hypothetical protein [Phreatobacter stygius]|uniref:Uncharacterized protein n=1 Tax=Phreatobacter stygius TaxID=1940610 RepID=A0A4D7BBV8_9HYPH|nr:hypothetical protein [Phreatobacter stygius]QCI68240.1 hypothetical protein E8M01_30845 [Phreatobacter stygius]
MSVQEPEARATAVSPLGTLSLHVTGASGVTIDVAQAQVPKLPEGMAVDGVMLICVRLAVQITRESPMRIRATADQDGHPETGEWLESMAFANGAGRLQVAMRDDAWLAARGVAAEPVQYERQGFSQVIHEAPAGTALYVSAAWRIDCATAAGDVSAWFAADLALPA